MSGAAPPVGGDEGGDANATYVPSGYGFARVEHGGREAEEQRREVEAMNYMHNPSSQNLLPVTAPPSVGGASDAALALAAAATAGVRTHAGTADDVAPGAAAHAHAHIAFNRSDSAEEGHYRTRPPQQPPPPLFSDAAAGADGGGGVTGGRDGTFRPVILHSEHPSMTGSVVHRVTNLTPGSDDQNTD